ncbi:MAG: hypothetical protein ACKVT0_15040 [Planctomycetaceae bacterium]
MVRFNSTRMAAVIGMLVIGGMIPSPVFAQGLIWSLPQDGSWVRFEGEIKQTELRPNSPDGDVEMVWIQHVIVKSVGQETAEYQGSMVPCRWIEIVSMTGKTSEAGIDTGPVGTTIYKALVPESAVIGQMIDANTIPVSFLPIVKGYRKIGTGEPELLKTPILQIYPLSGLLKHFENLKSVGDSAEDVETPVGFISSRKYEGQAQLESRSSRTANSAEIWLSTDVPFGMTKWTLKGTREKKESYEARDAFQPVTEITVELTVHETGMTAESELAIPGE